MYTLWGISGTGHGTESDQYIEDACPTSYLDYHYHQETNFCVSLFLFCFVFSNEMLKYSRIKNPVAKILSVTA